MSQRSRRSVSYFSGILAFLILTFIAVSLGYQASSAQTFLEGVQQALSNSVTVGEYLGGRMGLHFRHLGNVAYLMTSLNTPRTTIQALERAILDFLP